MTTLISIISMIVDVFKFAVFLVKGFKEFKKREPAFYVYTIEPEEMDPMMLETIEFLKEISTLDRQDPFWYKQSPRMMRLLDETFPKGYADALNAKLKEMAEQNKLSKYVLTEAESIKCPYCGKEGQILHSEHLKLHGKTMGDVFREFPDHPTITKAEFDKRFPTV